MADIKILTEELLKPEVEPTKDRIIKIFRESDENEKLNKPMCEYKPQNIEPHFKNIPGAGNDETDTDYEICSAELVK